MSGRLTPAAFTSISTSPMPGSGIGRLTGFSTSGLPGSVISMAVMVGGRVGIRTGSCRDFMFGELGADCVNSGNAGDWQQAWRRRDGRGRRSPPQQETGAQGFGADGDCRTRGVHRRARDRDRARQGRDRPQACPKNRRRGAVQTVKAFQAILPVNLPARKTTMLNPTSLLADALGRNLAETYRRIYGDREPQLCNGLDEAARLVIERIGSSDALYHDCEHTA